MAITHYYVDPGGGDDGTGDGSIGTPWKTAQHALDTAVEGSDGTQINIKASTAQVLGAPLDLTAYIATNGALVDSQRLILRGYTALANDGGRAEINCAGTAQWVSNYPYVQCVDLLVHTYGDNHGIYLGSGAAAIGCVVHKGASAPSGKSNIFLGAGGIIDSCYLYDDASGDASCARVSGGAGSVMNCYMIVTNGRNGIRLDSGGYVKGNIIKSAVNINSAIFAVNGQVTVESNIVYFTIASTGIGIYFYDGRGPGVARNNIICGASGVGGEGIYSDNVGPVIVGYNAFWNNTSNNVLSHVTVDETDHDVALAADPFTDAANGDFSLTEAAKTALAAAGWPASYLGAHANTVPNLNIGPIQMAAAAAAAARGRIIGG